MKKILLSLILVLNICGARGEELDELLRSVIQNNLELKVFREQMAAEGYDMKARNSLDATSVEYSPFFRRGADGIASSELIVTQEFDFPTLYAARGKTSRMQMNMLDKKYEKACRDLVWQTTEVYLNLVKLNRQRIFINSQLNNTARILELYTKRSEAGDATSIELNRVKIRKMELQTDLLANETAVAETLSKITSLNGYEEFGCKANEYPDWIHSVSETFLPDDDPEVKELQSAVETFTQEERLARQEWLPKLTLGYRRNTELEEASNGFVVGASFNLFSTSGKVKAAKARKTAAELEADNARRKVVNDMAAARRELALINNSLKTYDLSLLDETERLLNRSLELGQITATDYYIELEVVNEKRSSHIELEYEYFQRLCVLYRNALIRK